MDVIRALLTEMKLEAVAHRSEDMLVKADGSATVSETLTMMRERNILSVPVTDDGSNQFSGVFSVTDVLKALLKELKLDKAGSGTDILAADVASAADRVFSSPLSKVMHPGDLWYLQGQNPSVMDAVKDMLQRGQVHHRLFTCATLKDTQPTGILSQIDVVRLVADHRVELGDILRKSVREMGLCMAAVETVPAETPTLQVLTSMWRDHRTCMGITAGAGESATLVGNISASDLRLLTPDRFEMLTMPVGKFVLAIRGVPPPAGDHVDYSAALRAVPLHVVTPDSPFGDILSMLAALKLHRVYVVDAVERSTGIITLTDILRRLLPPVEVDAPEEGPGGGLPAGGAAA